MRTASVVVIGGGVIGASAAYHLCARGRRDVLVLDRGSGPGEGSTGRATGGFRAQFATPINVRLSLLSREKLCRFHEETGVDPGYVPAGYLWIATAEPELAGLREALRVQHGQGLHEATEVTPEDIALLNPAVRLDDAVGGAFCPTDGFIRPLSILEGYLAAARRLGARVEWGVEVTGFERDASSQIEAVELPAGNIAAEAVVNAAGAWAGEVALLAGADLPVSPVRRQVAATTPCERLPDTMPMTIVVRDGFHFRVRDGRVLLLWPAPDAPCRTYDLTVDSDWLEAVAAKARERVPALEDVALDPAASWAGLYEMSPDRHAILGAAPECPNLYFVNGSSGHGVMHAPALGHLLAEIVCDGRATTLEVGALRPSRFAEGRPNLSGEIL